MKRGSAGFDPLDWAGQHRFVLGSLVLHALVALWASLLAVQTAATAERAQAASAEARQQAARQAQARRHEQQLEQLRQQLGSEVPAAAANPASSPLERAQALTRALEEAERQARIKELARLLKISREAAAAQVRLEDVKRMKPPPADAAQALAQLAQRARDAAERRHTREQRLRDGMPLAGGGGKGVGKGLGIDGEGQGQGLRNHGSWLGGAGGHPPATVDYRRRYDGFVTPPAIDAAHLQRADDVRSFGPGGPFANRVYLNRWNLIGPFPAEDTRAINTVYPPEVVVDLDGVYPGKTGLVRWTPLHSSDYPFLPEPYAENAIYYAATELRVDRDMDVWLDIGADDDTKLWLNDELVWFSGNADKPWYHQYYREMPAELATYGLVEGRVRVSLRAGRNTLLLKLYNAPSITFFSVVLAP